MIKRIDARCLAYHEPHYRGMERCITVVRIESSDGTVGWGEGISQFREATLATRTLVMDGFAPLLLNEDPLRVERLWRKMCTHAYWYGVEGIAAFAISAIDMALWDLKGKLLGQPVANLLGGQLRDRVPAMASIIFDMDDLNWTLNEFQTFRDEGYRIVKAGWGMHPASMFGQERERDLRFVREIRQVIGDDIALVVDVPGAKAVWDVPIAIRRCRELEQYDLRWIEQPLPPHDLDGYARLRTAVAVPIGAGEDEWSPETCGHVIRANAVDVLNIDPGRCLGLTGCRDVVKMAETAGLRCTAHSWSSALNTAASLHFLAISDHCDTLDFKPHVSPMQDDIVEAPWRQQDGYLAIRTVPGLGVDIREDVLERYAFV